MPNGMANLALMLFVLPTLVAQTASSPCDLDGNGVVNIVDVQIAVNEVLGLAPCTMNLDGTGVCDATDVQRVVTAALGGPCVVTAPATSSTTGLNVNVTAYGAIGDGVTDDTAALVSASQAVALNGGTLTIPAGTYIFDPTLGHIALGSNMTITGTGTIRVKPGVGNFDYIIGPNPSYAVISNVTIHGITVDENVLNNPSTIGDALTQQQNIILAQMLTNLNVNNVTFYVSGIYAISIYDYLTLQDSYISFEKRSDNAWFDNSAIYLPTDQSTCLITNTTFEGSTPGANTAIEVHKTKSCQISANRVDSYVTAVLPLDPYSVTIDSNIVTKAQYAISVWSDTLAQNVTVTNNTISLNNLDRQSFAAAGIALYWTTSGYTGSFNNITIENNSITFQPEVRTNVSGYSYWGIGIQPAGNVDTVTIQGNTITNAPIRGIKVGNQLAGNTTSNVTVNNNTLVNPGNNTDMFGYEAGIALDGALNNVSVTNNIIENTVSPFTGHYGIWSNLQGTYLGTTQAGNQIEGPYINELAPSIGQ